MMTQDEIERRAQPADIERYRSTPLRPVVWMTSVLVWATVVALILRVPTWAGIFLCASTGVSFLLFLVGYIYLFATDRELLRAERYRARTGKRVLTVESQDASELSLGDRGYQGLEQAAQVVAPIGARESRTRVSE